MQHRLSQVGSVGMKLKINWKGFVMIQDTQKENLLMHYWNLHKYKFVIENPVILHRQEFGTMRNYV